MQDNWVDPEKAAFRATLGQQLASQVGVPIDQTGSDVVVFASTSKGKDLAPRLAAAMDAAIATDVTAHEPRRR